MSCKYLAHTLLEPIRSKFGPIRVQSWVRSIELNFAVGGTGTSEHLNGTAVDILPVNGDLWGVFNWVHNNVDLDWRQLIIYPDKNFIHLSCNNPYKERKRTAFMSKDGKYIPYNKINKEDKEFNYG